MNAAEAQQKASILGLRVEVASTDDWGDSLYRLVEQMTGKPLQPDVGMSLAEVRDELAMRAK